MLVRSFPTYGMSQQVVTVFLRSDFLQPYHYSLLPGHTAEHPMYNPMRKRFHWPISPMMFTVLYLIVVPAHRIARMAGNKAAKTVLL